MIISALFVLMVVIVIIQPSTQRKVITGAYVSAVILFDLLTENIVGATFYLLSGIIAMSFMILMIWSKDTWIAIGLAQVCFMSIVGSFIGWLVWENSLNQGIYESIFILIYCYAIFVMLRKECRGDNKNNLSRLWFRTAFDSRLQYIFKGLNKT